MVLVKKGKGCALPYFPVLETGEGAKGQAADSLTMFSGTLVHLVP